MECIDRYLGDGMIIVKATSIGPDGCYGYVYY